MVTSLEVSWETGRYIASEWEMEVTPNGRNLVVAADRDSGWRLEVLPVVALRDGFLGLVLHSHSQLVDSGTKSAPKSGL